MYLPSTAPLSFKLPASAVPPGERSERMTLEHDALLCVRRPRGHVVECVRGLVWITHDCEPHDIILSPGQRHVAVTNARMIVQGLEESDVRIRMPQDKSRAALLRWGHGALRLWANVFRARQAASAVR